MPRDLQAAERRGAAGLPVLLQAHRTGPPERVRRVPRGPGQGAASLIVHGRGEPFPLEDHYANFQTVLRLVDPSKPTRSRFLRSPSPKPTGTSAPRRRSFPQGEQRSTRTGCRSSTGRKSPPLPTRRPCRCPRDGRRTSSLQAEDLDLGGDLEDARWTAPRSSTSSSPSREGGRLLTTLRVLDAGPYRLTFRLAPGRSPLALGLRGRDAARVARTARRVEGRARLRHAGAAEPAGWDRPPAGRARRTRAPRGRAPHGRTERGGSLALAERPAPQGRGGPRPAGRRGGGRG